MKTDSLIQRYRTAIVFGRCLVRMSAGTLDNLKCFSWLSTVPSGKSRDRPRQPLPFKSLQIHCSMLYSLNCNWVTKRTLTRSPVCVCCCRRQCTKNLCASNRLFHNQYLPPGPSFITRVIKSRPWHRSGVTGFPLRHPGFKPKSGHVVFVVDKVALEQVFCKYFSFPCQSSFHQLLHNHQHLSSGAGTVGQLVADVPSGLSLTTPQETKEKGKSKFSVIIN
jgi:hypothetical protein